LQRELNAALNVISTSLQRYLTEIPGEQVGIMKDRFEAADQMEEIQNALSQVKIDRAVEILTEILPVEQAAVGPLAVEVQRLEKKLANKIKKCHSLGFKEMRPLEPKIRAKFLTSGQAYDADTWRKERDASLARLERETREAAAKASAAAKKKAI